MTPPPPDPRIRALRPVNPRGSAPRLERDSRRRHAHSRPLRPLSLHRRPRWPLVGGRDSATAVRAHRRARPGPAAHAVHARVVGSAFSGKPRCKLAACRPPTPQARTAPGTPCTGTCPFAAASRGPTAPPTIAVTALVPLCQPARLLYKPPSSSTPAPRPNSIPPEPVHPTPPVPGQTPVADEPFRGQ